MSEAEVPVSTVPIPDEAVEAVWALGYAYDGAVAGSVAAAAPFIARAAQVQVLREMAKEYQRLPRETDTWAEIAERLRWRADELEGGQR